MNSYILTIAINGKQHSSKVEMEGLDRDDAARRYLESLFQPEGVTVVEAEMVEYVIRSMSTSDARPGEKPQPYHIFLKPAHLRHGAYWATYGDVAKFATAAEALAEAKRSLKDENSYDIVPHTFHKHGLPNYWDKFAA